MESRGLNCGGLNLPDFLGLAGLKLLRQILAEEPQNPKEVIDLIKRLFLPGFDRTRGWRRPTRVYWGDCGRRGRRQLGGIDPFAVAPEFHR